MSEIDRIISDVELQRGSMCTIPKHEFWALVALARAKTEADLIAKLERAEEALKPFANVANEWGRTHGDAYKFTLMDLRRAQAYFKSNPT